MALAETVPLGIGGYQCSIARRHIDRVLKIDRTGYQLPLYAIAAYGTQADIDYQIARRHSARCTKPGMLLIHYYYTRNIIHIAPISTDVANYLLGT